MIAHPRAVAAFTAFERQQQQAEEAYARTMATARTKAIAQLERIRDDLAKTANRAETAAVQATIDHLRSELTPAEAKSKAEILRAEQDKLRHALAGTTWQQQGVGRITIILLPDGTLTSSHTGGKGAWEVVDGRRFRMSPFSTRQLVEFQLRDEKTITGADNPSPEGTFEFRSRRDEH